MTQAKKVRLPWLKASGCNSEHVEKVFRKSTGANLETNQPQPRPQGLLAFQYGAEPPPY